MAEAAQLDGLPPNTPPCEAEKAIVAQMEALRKQLQTVRAARSDAPAAPVTAMDPAGLSELHPGCGTGSAAQVVLGLGDYDGPDQDLAPDTKQAREAAASPY